MEQVNRIKYITTSNGKLFVRTKEELDCQDVHITQNMITLTLIIGSIIDGLQLDENMVKTYLHLWLRLLRKISSHIHCTPFLKCKIYDTFPMRANTSGLSLSPSSKYFPAFLA